MKREGTRAENRFLLSAKRTSPFKSAGVSVQSTAGSRGVRISGSNAGYTMFRGSVRSTGYPLHSPVSLHFPSLASPCAITFQLDSTRGRYLLGCVGVGLTTLPPSGADCLEILEALSSWRPKGLSRPVNGLLDFYLFIQRRCQCNGLNSVE